MLVTADRKSPLGYFCGRVTEMKPGERLKISRRDLADIPSYEHNGATFTPPHRILGNIIGSAYTHSFYEEPDGSAVVFVRHENTGERRSEDPDTEFRLARLRRPTTGTENE